MSEGYSPAVVDHATYGETLTAPPLPSSEVLGFQPIEDTNYQTGEIVECFPLRDIFDRLAAEQGIPAEGWRIVVFRSTLNPAASEAAQSALWAYDANAFDEAREQEAGGQKALVDYLKGFADERGNNVSMCIWLDRAAALETVHGEEHRKAVKFARDNEVYLDFGVELYDVNYEDEYLAVTRIRPPRPGGTASGPQ